MSRVLQHKTFTTLSDALSYAGSNGELSVISGAENLATAVIVHTGVEGGGCPAGKLNFGSFPILYVDDETGVDSVSDGRGFSAEKPWKTFGFAWEILCKYIDSSSGYVTIHLAPGDYQMPHLVCFGYSHFSITIDGNNDAGSEVTITGYTDAPCNFYSGTWIFRKIHFKPNNSTTSVTIGNQAVGYMYNCTVDVPISGSFRGSQCLNNSFLAVLDNITYIATNSDFGSTYAGLVGSSYNSCVQFRGQNQKIILRGFDNCPATTYLFAPGETSIISDVEDGGQSPSMQLIGEHGNMGGSGVYTGGRIQWGGEYYRTEPLTTFFNGRMFSNIAQAPMTMSVGDDTGEAVVDENRAMLARLDAEYRRVGILK